MDDYMDIKKIKSILELINNTDVKSITVSEGDKSISITREIQETTSTKITNNEKKATQQSDTTINKFKNKHVIRAPIVGTFYRSVAPGEKPFVDVGAHVKAGDTLCIIEAMKMMNYIEADCSGIIREILVNDENPVEFNQPLFVID